MIISIDAEIIEQSTTSIHDKKKKKLNKVGLEGTYLSIIKAISEKQTYNIVLNGE